MNNLTTDSPFGVIFLRFSDLKGLDVNRYFDCLRAVKPLLESSDFTDSTPGFYINYITNSEGGNSVRLTYFTENEAKTKNAIEDFLNANSKIVLFSSHDSKESQKGNIAEGYGGENLRFRRFLNTYTQIGLDLLDYDILYSRRLVAEYRLTYSTQKISPKPLFEPAFNKHSKFFCQLDSFDIEQLWKDLNFWHPIKISGYVADWTHFLVNMLLPSDWIYLRYIQTGELVFKDLFLKPDPRPPIKGEERKSLLKYFDLNIPHDWKPND